MKKIIWVLLALLFTSCRSTAYLTEKQVSAVIIVLYDMDEDGVLSISKESVIEDAESIEEILGFIPSRIDKSVSASVPDGDLILKYNDGSFSEKIHIVDGGNLFQIENGGSFCLSSEKQKRLWELTEGLSD